MSCVLPSVRSGFANAVDEYSKFASIIESNAQEVIYLDGNENLSIDSIYVRDSLITTNRGLILCRMGKDVRMSEPSINSILLKQHGLNILGEITFGEDDEL